MSEVEPLVLIAAFGALLALGAIVAACKVHSVLAKALMGVLVAVFLIPAALATLVFHTELIDARVRTYKALYSDIQVGMTRAEVFEAVDRRYPQTGIRMRPRVMKDDPGNLGFFMNPEGQGEPNCEGIFLSLELDRVKSKQYSMD